MVAGAAVQKLMMTLSKEQEILMNIADMSIITYHAESALLRLEKLSKTKSEAELAVQTAIVKPISMMLLTQSIKQVKTH